MKDFSVFSDACRKYGGTISEEISPMDSEEKRKVLLVSGSFTNEKTAKNTEVVANFLKKTGLMPVFLSPLRGKSGQKLTGTNIPAFTAPEKEIPDLILQGADLFELVILCSAKDASLATDLNGENIPVLWMISGMDDEFIWKNLKNLPIFKCRNITVAAAEPNEKNTLLKHRPEYKIYDISECFSSGIGQEAAFSRLLKHAGNVRRNAASQAALKIEKKVFLLLEREREILGSSKVLLNFWNKVRGMKTVKQHKLFHLLLRLTGWDKRLEKVYFPPWELYRQRRMTFPRELKLSIVVPLYNTPKLFLWEMLKSVRKQTYANWELCLADGSDAAHRYVETLCRILSVTDHRIRYRKLEQNFGISGNTNAALELAKGDYIALLDHDDILHPAALYVVAQAIVSQGADLIYTDETSFHQTIQDAFNPHFKPDYAPDNLRSNNYICHFTVFKKNLLDSVGHFRPECDGSQDFDMVLRLTEQAKRIVHIPIILYYWRAHPGSVAENIDSKPYAIEAGCRAVRDHLSRIGLKGEVFALNAPGVYRIRYALNGLPKISILIPSRDHAEDLSHCISSIIEKTTYPDWEIIIIDNSSIHPETFSYYEKLKDEERIRVVSWNGEFNYPAINNYGAGFATGDYLILLNNDTGIITPEWIEEMLMFAQREDVGAVGAKLYYPDDTVQHAGVYVGLGGVAGHIFSRYDRKATGYMNKLIYAQNFSAVTAACMMIPRRVWNQLGGLNPDYAVAFNDVDLCMRIREAGYLIIWTPFAELYHYESKSRGYEDSPEKIERFQREVQLFRETWKEQLETGDPYYNPNFALDRENYSAVPVNIARGRIEERNKHGKA